MTVLDLPAVNASLNGLSAVFLATGYIFIRQKHQIAHRNCMIAAFATSTIFLVCYVVYHGYRYWILHIGPTRFLQPEWFKPIYLVILGTHTILAIVIVPMILVTLNRARLQRFEFHKKIARWTLPLWMYVSVTGVLVYWLLYVKFPQH